MKRCLLLVLGAVFALGFLAPSHAVEIYRWTDAQGRTHVSDRAPEQYRMKASRIDSKQFELNAEQQKEIADRTANENLKATEASSSQPSASTKTPRPNKAAAKPITLINAGLPPDGREPSDCATLHRLYRESMDCFARYIQPTPYGAHVKPEAWAHCSVRDDPTSQCGKPKVP